MPFAKDHPKVGGKKKGSRHKSTIIREKLHLDSWSGLAAFIEGPGLKRYIQELSLLEGKDYTTAYNAVAEYVKPKLQRTEHTGHIQNINYNVDLTKTEIKAIVQTFEDDY